jgi:hypothetical protein
MTGSQSQRGVPSGAYPLSPEVRRVAELECHLGIVHKTAASDVAALGGDWLSLVQHHGDQHQVGFSHLHEGQPDYFGDYQDPLRDPDEDADGSQDPQSPACRGVTYVSVGLDDPETGPWQQTAECDDIGGCGWRVVMSEVGRPDGSWDTTVSSDEFFPLHEQHLTHRAAKATLDTVTTDELTAASDPTCARGDSPEVQS